MYCNIKDLVFSPDEINVFGSIKLPVEFDNDYALLRYTFDLS